MSILGKNLFQSNRSSLTCTYKCGNACAGEAPNHSDNAYFGDIMSRRGALKVMGAGAVTIGGGAALAACGADSDSEAASTVAETATSTSKVTETSKKRTNYVAYDEMDETVVVGVGSLVPRPIGQSYSDYHPRGD